MAANKQLSYISKYRLYSIAEIESELKCTIDISRIEDKSKQRWQLPYVRNTTITHYFGVWTDLIVDKFSSYSPEYSNQYLNIIFACVHVPDVNHPNYWFLNDKTGKHWRVIQLCKDNKPKQMQSKMNDGHCYNSMGLYKNMDCTITELLERIKVTVAPRLAKVDAIELEKNKQAKARTIQNVSIDEEIKDWADTNGFNYSKQSNRWNLSKASVDSVEFRIYQNYVKKYDKYFLELRVRKPGLEFKYGYFFKNEDTENLLKTLDGLKMIDTIPTPVVDYHNLLDKND